MRHFEVTFEKTFFYQSVKVFLTMRPFCKRKRALDTTFDFSAQGFYVYRGVWRSFEKEFLKCDSEIGNLIDMFAIKVYRSSDHYKIIACLPREISRPRKFSIDLGKSVTTTVRLKNVRISLLLQKDLEILCRVKVVIPKTLNKRLLLDRYCKMVHELNEELELDYCWCIW